MDWDDLRYFAAVADEGSLSGAARRIGVNASTVSRHIDALEAHLGVRLFERGADGYTPTSGGTKLREHAARIEAEVFALVREFDAEDRGLEGVVSLTVPDFLAGPFVVRHMPVLRERHPGVRLDLIADNRELNLSRREADVALRLARPEQGDLLVRRIGTVGYGLYASPAYVAQRGAPSSLDDLRNFDLFNFVDDYAHFGPVEWLRRYRGDRPPVFRSNSAMERIEAAVAGVGISLAPVVAAARRPDLVRLLPDAPMPTLDLWLLVHRDIARTPRVRAVLDFLGEQAKADAERLGPATD